MGYSVLCTQYCVLSIVYSVFCTQYCVLSIVYSVLCTQYIVLSIVYSVLCTQYCVLSIVYSVLCTQYSGPALLSDYSPVSTAVCTQCILVLYPVPPLYIPYCTLYLIIPQTGNL